LNENTNANCVKRKEKGEKAMKATGIVRRIDDLGRVVIPKEIRRTMRIREGDPLEIYTDRDGEVIFKKYSPIGELSTFAVEYADAVSRTGGFPVLVTDRDAVIAASGISKKSYMERALSPELEQIMDQRLPFAKRDTGAKPIAALRDGDADAIVASPIISEGDVIGSVVILKSHEESIAGDVEVKLAEAAASFLGRHLES
jgi:AbrB family transcriptional regulator (stage V sporulation protein T)